MRLSDGEPLAHLVRTVAAGVLAGSALTVSTAVELPAQLRTVLSGLGIDVTVENDADWLASAGRLAGAARLSTSRIRLIGGDAKALAEATGGRPDLAVYFHPVTEAGRVELLPFLHEQAVSITAHRFGTPEPHLGRTDLGPASPAALPPGNKNEPGGHPPIVAARLVVFVWLGAFRTQPKYQPGGTHEAGTAWAEKSSQPEQKYVTSPSLLMEPSRWWVAGTKVSR